ncbi:prenyltransferase, partial [filamentous cyanobacterium Phorm 46]
MIRQIWQRILNLWRQIQRRFRKQPAPPPPKPTPIRSFGEYEQKFMALLEGVEEGWSRGDIKGFLIGSKIKDAEWENWLQEFGERLLVSPETHLELGGRMVRLGEMNCGKISEVAGNIGRQLLAGESLSRNPAEVRSVISENTDDSSAANQGDSTSQSQSIRKEVSQEVEELYDQGRKFYYAGDLEGAIAAFEKALEIDPKFHDAWNNLVVTWNKRGNILKNLGRYTEAEAAYNKALEIDPKFHFAWNNLGCTLNDLGRNTEAMGAYKTALKFDPKFHFAWNGLGNALSYLGRYTEAEAAYNKALEIDREDHEAWNGLGTTLNDLGRYSEAEAAFNQALEIDREDHDAWNGLGNALRGLERNKKAIAAFDKALEITANQYWEAWGNRGWAFFNSGGYLEAIQNWDEGLQKYLPSNRDYRLACGNLHKEKGKAHYQHGKEKFTYFESFHKAKASYEQAREFLISPLIPETYLEVMQGLITVCRSLGDTKTREYLAEATI